MSENTETLAQYVERRGITCEIVQDRGSQIEDGWEHHAYVVALTMPTGERLETPWRQGYGIETSPTDTPSDILDALVSDATSSEVDFETWCDEYGYDPDSRKKYAMWEACQEIGKALTAFLGGSDELQHLAYEVERP